MQDTPLNMDEFKNWFSNHRSIVFYKSIELLAKVFPDSQWKNVYEDMKSKILTAPE